ncbi:MAG: tripartite tricarboxylate transporter TctB family protein [Burkholderiales bacterium]|nr:tripartite tricarboxylate transporter TctB family protein [Burkholderiales bacterium]
MKFHDVISAAVIALLAGWVLFHIQSFPPMPGQKYGPAVYPGLIAGGLLICALLLAVRGLRTREPGGWIKLDAWWGDARIAFGFWLIVGVLAAYTQVSERLGFIPCAIVALFALTLTFRVRPALALVVAVAGTILIHTIFYKGLRVPLPWGLLTPVAW